MPAMSISPSQPTYRGHTVYQTTLPTQGHIVLEELNIIENVDISGLGHNSADALHLMIEAKKRAFADRNAYSRDPKFGHVPLETHALQRFRSRTLRQHRPAQRSRSGCARRAS